MKGEYSNLFVASTNSHTQEMVITFKQSTFDSNPNIQVGGNDNITSTETVIDISKIIMTTENAKQLIDLLNDVLTKSNNSSEEP